MLTAAQTGLMGCAFLWGNPSYYSFVLMLLILFLNSASVKQLLWFTKISEIRLRMWLGHPGHNYYGGGDNKISKKEVIWD